MSEADPQAGPLRRTLRLVGPDVKPQWGMVLAGVIVLLFEVAFRVMEPWPLKIVIDSVLPALTPNSTQTPASVRFLLLCGLMLVAIVAMRAVCNYVATVCFALVGSRTSARLRARVFRHVQQLSQEFHSRNRSADTVQRIVSDVARMQDVAISAGMPLLANIATLVVMLGVMFWLDPLLASVVVVAILIFWLTSRGSSSRITHASRQTRKGEGQLANTAQESLSSIKVVQAYGLEAKIEERFVGANRVSLLEGVKALRLAARLERSTDVIVGLATATVIVGGGLRVLDGAMTPGELVLFVTYLRTTMKPLRDMAKYTGRIARAGASGERVADLMAITPTIQTPAVPVLPPHFTGNLRFSDVHTQYENSPVLKGVNLALGPGEYVAIIGPSGAGKSTLVNLVTRAQDPTFGQVTLDDVPLPQLDLNHLRANVSVLHQEAVLFAGTIRENIRLGRAAATDAEIEAAARAAHAHDFICRLPAGYDTTVGERGGTLSGGQRQRIAIARALLRSAPVVVLDEATTGLDPESAGLVLDAIDQLVAGRTTLAVTHDVEVALRATRVVWLEAGRVLLDGPPQQLLADSPAFRDWVAAARPPRQIDPAGSR